MENTIAPYSEYKSSNIPFIDLIPSHWEEKTFNLIASEKSIINNNDEELLSVFLNLGVIKYQQTSGKQVHKPSDDLSLYQLVEPGDLVLNNQQAWRGSVGVSYYRGIVSPAYYVFKLSKLLHPVYANYLFRDRLMVTQFVMASKGVGSIQRNLFFPWLKKVIVPIPPIEEQQQISNFLNFILLRIDKYIKTKKRIIEKLKELKKVVISESVTRGLKSNTPMKNSEIDWLGDVPKHWIILRNKDVMLKKKNLVGDEFGNYRLLSLTIKGVIERDVESGKGKFPSDFSTYQKVMPGDLVFCLFDIDETPRTVGISTIDGMITGAYNVFTPKNVNGKYLYYYYLSLDDKKSLKPLYTGLRKVIPEDVFLRVKIALPPISEQEEIVNFINKKIARIEEVIKLTEDQILFMIEFKHRLISDAVTGVLNLSKYKTPDFNCEEMNDLNIFFDGFEEDE